ncbi:hypothetical protein QQ008_21285 [Fulvivirgaceae bacterium BMA10]|uniref:Uncharacterized protein n=1 Tax=Splendidivirga corallicola TaxID=3051826 RepID=A0ABT8KWX4_9BACT|nr:hypothetical protein [Fulvivirgaceae bacterium BMA10]
MPRRKKPIYITAKSKRVKLSDADIENGISKVDEVNRKTRSSFRYDNKALSFKAGR